MIEDMKLDSQRIEMSTRNGRYDGIQDNGASIQCPTPPSDGSEGLHENHDQVADNDITMSDEDKIDASVAL
jgi:hypothetical protein